MSRLIAFTQFVIDEQIITWPYVQASDGHFSLVNIMVTCPGRHFMGSRDDRETALSDAYEKIAELEKTNRRQRRYIFILNILAAFLAASVFLG